MRLRSVSSAGRLAALCVVVACGRGVDPAAEGLTRPAPEQATTGGSVIFADEFPGPSLDRTLWSVYTGTVYNDELQEYVDDAANIHIARGAEAEGADGGALVLRARRHVGRSPEFTSGRLHGTALFRYGTITARMKLPEGAGLWPAFWLLGGGPWPHHGEIDVMENVGDPTWVSAALHGPGFSGDTPLVRRTTFPAAHDATGWHEYSVTWSADSIVFRVDDVAYYRVRRSEVERHGSAAPLDSAKYVVLNLAIGGTYPAAVNGVRTPRLGLPDATLPRIDAGEARILVDWVRATR